MKTITPTEALDRMYPLSCFLVISTDKKGKPYGMTASWLVQSSHKPPMVAVAIGKARFTHNLIKDSKEFVVAIPDKQMEKSVLYFGNTSGRDVDKFKETKVKTQKSKFLKEPLLSDAKMNFECKVIGSADSGDHTIFVGKVIAAYVNEGKKTLMYMGKEPGKRLFEEF